MEITAELRRIRITLIFLAIFILFTGGNRTVTNEVHDNEQPNFNFSNMVPLENGYFGVLSSDSISSSKIVDIYYYDKTKNELLFKKEENLDDITNASDQ
jgi:hypothetical protein